MAINEFFELETVHFDVSSCPITTIFWGGWWFEGFGLNKTTWKEKKYCWNSSPEQPSIRDKKGRQLLLTLSSVPRFAPAFCPYLLCTALSTSRLRRFGHFPSAAFEWYSPRTKSKTIKQRRPCWGSSCILLQISFPPYSKIIPRFSSKLIPSSLNMLNFLSWIHFYHI